MPRDGIADEVENALDPVTALPAWVKGEKRLSSMLPYVSLVTDRTIRTRGNELMQCIRLEGVNSTTSEDGHLDRIGGLLAGIVAQVGTEFSFYLHKVSKAVDVTRAVAADAPNANYAVSAREEFTPTAIWDDGTFTYFRFARNAPVPAIFRYANGGERAVNSTALEDGVIRVSGVNRQWVLRLGEDEVCVQDMSGHAS